MVRNEDSQPLNRRTGCLCDAELLGESYLWKMIRDIRDQFIRVR